jgi:hypothetical protein
MEDSMKLPIPALAIILTALTPTACGDSAADPLAPDAALEAKGGTQGKPGGGDDGGGATLVADLVTGDFLGAGGTAWISLGSAGTSSNGAVLFKHTRCGDVTPEGSAYALTDENRMEVKAKGRNIVGVRFWGQDVIGDAGIAHETDWIAVDIPKSAIADGYTFHVHADNVAVWRTDGHLTGKRVEVIGTINIGDVVYSNGTAAICEGGTAG